MKIDYMRVCELRPYPNNARTHSKKQVRLIANSITKFGFCNPVLIDDDGRSSLVTAAWKPPSYSASTRSPPVGSRI